jgi:hypothetical protein
MNKEIYIVKLAKLIAVNERVNLDKLKKIIELNEEFYSSKQYT